ncbi:chemotaxis protein CheX [Desulfatibacillum aliphaticivorans]|uniref:chemotaxis protein CheX n=1 Tax=Desulfatibacillum aliphaticivorans TaxID=218208 RepID=UPI0003FAC8CE|nr:chemotaxis protein CheX [Desulfatibacillum aliphaticivorans]
MEPDKFIEETLRQVVLTVFEQMYFMFPQEVGMKDASECKGDETYIANVGLKNGGLEVTIAGSAGLCEKIASAMFGEDRELTQKDVEDVFREAANIIMGNLINECAFPGEVSPDIPVARKGMDLEDCKNEHDLNLFFEVENSHFSAHLKGSAASDLTCSEGNFTSPS